MQKTTGRKQESIFFYICFVCIVLSFYNNSICTGQDHNQAFSKKDIALIKEFYNLQSQLGTQVWPGWKPSKAPILYKFEIHDFLINHPDPPVEYNKISDNLWKSEIWTKKRRDTLDIESTTLINNIGTVVMTRPGLDEDPCVWVLKAAHEQFHLFQDKNSSERIINPFTGTHENEHELSYTFPYDSLAVKSVMRLEAEHVYTAINDKSFNDSRMTMTRKLIKHLSVVQEAIFSDPNDLRYKKWIEWQEGVSRYVERKLALLAADSSLYEPTKEFKSQFPNAGYKQASQQGRFSINPVRFVGEGVRGRVQFYYLGMGKALLLDKISPDWQHRYFQHDLDILIHTK